MPRLSHRHCRRHWLGVACLLPLVVIAAAAAPAADPPPSTKPASEFKAITVDDEDVAAVSCERAVKGTRVRVKVINRGDGGIIRIGLARTMAAGVGDMTTMNAPNATVSFTQSIKNDAYIAVAAGAKESPLKLLSAETKDHVTTLKFDTGWVVEVTVTPPRTATPATQGGG